MTRFGDGWRGDMGPGAKRHCSVLNFVERPGLPSSTVRACILNVTKRCMNEISIMRWSAGTYLFGSKC